MGLGYLFRTVLAGAALFALSGCEIVDTGPDRVGGTSCGFSNATPGTWEYENCRRRNTHNPRTNSRTPGGGIF